MIEINRDPSERQLRQFAGIWFPSFCLLLGSLLRVKLGLVAVPYGLWAAGALVLLLGLPRPSLVRWVFVGMSLLTFPIGLVVSNVVLVLLYYLVLTPIGLARRLLGRDVLGRRLDRRPSTYWRPRRSEVPVERYFRQF